MAAQGGNLFRVKNQTCQQLHRTSQALTGSSDLNWLESSHAVSDQDWPNIFCCLRQRTRWHHAISQREADWTGGTSNGVVFVIMPEGSRVEKGLCPLTESTKESKPITHFCCCLNYMRCEVTCLNKSLQSGCFFFKINGALIQNVLLIQIKALQWFSAKKTTLTCLLLVSTVSVSWYAVKWLVFFILF